MRMQIEVIRMLITMVHGRADKARREGRNELGASAIEWAIISALVVALAILVFNMVKGAIGEKADDINKEP